MKLHIIGSGCPDARTRRHGSAFALESADEMILVDCGPAATYKMARMGLHPLQVGHLFLTHHHFDHNADLPCFLLTWWDQSKGTEPPLHVYGPQPTRDIVDKLVGPQGAFRLDINSRLEHPASHWCHEHRGGVLPRPAPRFEVRDLADGDMAESSTWTAKAVVVQHVEPTMVSLAYRFETAEGSVLFAGDCTDCAALRELAVGVDTLVIVCTHFGRDHIDRAITDCVAGTPEVSSIARESNVKRAILTHGSPAFENPKNIKRAIDEVQRGFDGQVLFPEELETVVL